MSRKEKDELKSAIAIGGGKMEDFERLIIKFKKNSGVC